MSAVAMQGAPDKLVSLGELVAARGKSWQAAPGFQAWVSGEFADGSAWDGGPLLVTAVLQRTAVLEVGRDDRRLADHHALLVDPATVQWREAEPPASPFERQRQLR